MKRRRRDFESLRSQLVQTRSRIASHGHLTAFHAEHPITTYDLYRGPSMSKRHDFRDLKWQRSYGSGTKSRISLIRWKLTHSKMGSSSPSVSCNAVKSQKCVSTVIENPRACT